MKMIISLSFAFSFLSVYSQDTTWTTFYERSGGKETPRYEQTVQFCKRLAKASYQIHFTSFGKSGRGKDLPLVIADKDGLADPKAIRAAGRIVILIEACIHPGECEGKDAGLMLLRDLVILKKYPGLLDHVSILFIPIFNIDGHERFGPYNRINQNGPAEMGWRVNARNLNLNRDFLKADTPEMQCWLTLFNRWMPEFFIDTHTTDGADYQYVLTYGMELGGDMDPGLTAWSQHFFLDTLEVMMNKSGFPIFPYVGFRNWEDPKSGLETSVSPPMLSEVYTSLRNRPGLLIETHMLKPYDQRVRSTYACLEHSLTILSKEYKSLSNDIKNADKLTTSRKFRITDFPLQYKTDENDSTMTDFLGVEYQKVKSEITGEYWYRYGTRKETYRLPYFNKVKPVVFTKIPEVYIIPVEWNEVIERLGMHGIKIHRTLKDTIVNVSSYKIMNAKWQAKPYEGRHPLTGFEMQEITEARSVPAGSAIVDMNQPQARVIVHILEPKGNGSYMYWGFFDPVFEQKEYAENYVIEAMAPKLLEDNPLLKAEFLKKKSTDTAFTKSPALMLNWLYSKTPYWDSGKDVFPVGKIFDPAVAAKLLAR
jgi:hypothetical protein